MPEPQRETCPECGRVCPGCFGNGYAVKWDRLSLAPNADILQTVSVCPRCSGTGTVAKEEK